MLFHHHRPVVVFECRNGKSLVGTEVRYDARMAGRRDHIGTGHASQTFSDTASDRFFFANNHHPEAVSEGMTFESHLHSAIRTTLRGVFAVNSVNCAKYSSTVDKFENRNITSVD